MSAASPAARARFEWSHWLLVGPALACVFMFILVPLMAIGLNSFWQRSPVGIVEQTFTLESWQEFFGDSFYVEILWRTMKLSALATFTVALLGYPVAYTLSRLDDRWRAALILLLFLPSWISFVVRTMSWLHVLGPSGLVNLTLQRMGLITEPLPLLYNDFSIYMGLVHYLITYMILNIYIGLQSVDRNVVDAARTLGASEWQAFLQVTLPLSVPGLAAGCLLCFILASGTYITPMLLGGPGNVYFPSLIYDAMIPQLDWPMGAVLALVFVIVLVLLVGIYARFAGLSHLTKKVS